MVESANEHCGLKQPQFLQGVIETPDVDGDAAGLPNEHSPNQRKHPSASRDTQKGAPYYSTVSVADVELDWLFEVPVTVTVYVLLDELPQPLTPAAARLRPRISSTEIVRLIRLPVLRNAPAKGSRSSASENGARVRPRLPVGCAAAEFSGIWMVRVSGVLPAPATVPFGEKIAVAPVGNPLATKVTAKGMVEAPLVGAMVKVRVGEAPDAAVKVGFDAVIVKSGAVEFTVTVEVLEVEAASFVVAP